MTQIVDAYCTPGTERETRLSAEDLLKWMDEAGIDRAVIAPEDRELALKNAEGNDRMLRLADRFADRFIPACTANPWSGPAGCRELERAAGAGAKMLVLAPALQGFLLGDPVADELLQLAGELRVPVYAHTGPHSAAAPTQLVLLAAQHAQTQFILGHCGSTDYAHDMPAVLRAAPENVWFELSLVRPFAASGYAAMVDHARLIFGSSAPRNHPAFELGHLATYLPVEDHPGIYGGNLLRLLAS
ncbi:MAG: amidohydrolase family protein [Planctomycetota bacterium]